jgi:hypothetical protein
MIIKAQKLHRLWTVAIEIDGAVYCGFETSYRRAQGGAICSYVRRRNRG